MLLRKCLIYLDFNSVNWNFSRVFGLRNLSLRYTGEINVEDIKV